MLALQNVAVKTRLKHAGLSRDVSLKQTSVRRPVCGFPPKAWFYENNPLAIQRNLKENYLLHILHTHLNC